MQITSAFDAGNIEVIDASDPSRVRLRIRPDAGNDHFQWFYFRITGARDQPLVLVLENASEASYPRGWPGYRACVSTDRRTWSRTDTTFDGRELTIRYTPPGESVWIAYFAPYSLERHHDLVARSAAHPDVVYRSLGRSVEGRDIDLLQAGLEAPDGPKVRPRIWIIARQHPGETMAEWLVEGLLERLLEDADPVARALRSAASLYIVPNMNPDGSVRGHLRNNAAGANLNREWDRPTLERSPEVYAVRHEMERTGVDFFLDVHGDEVLPYNFVAGAEGTPSWSEARAERQASFAETLARHSPDFQTDHGYPVARPGQANMSMATNWVAERFGCLALTLEQPFKDTADSPRPEGWSSDRARCLGRAVLGALWSNRSAFVGG